MSDLNKQLNDLLNKLEKINEEVKKIIEDKNKKSIK